MEPSVNELEALPSEEDEGLTEENEAVHGDFSQIETCTGIPPNSHPRPEVSATNGSRQNEHDDEDDDAMSWASWDDHLRNEDDNDNDTNRNDTTAGPQQKTTHFNKDNSNKKQRMKTSRPKTGGIFDDEEEVRDEARNATSLMTKTPMRTPPPDGGHTRELDDDEQSLQRATHVTSDKSNEEGDENEWDFADWNDGDSTTSSGGTFDPNIIEVDKLGQAPHSDDEDADLRGTGTNGEDHIRKPRRPNRKQHRKVAMDLNNRFDDGENSNAQGTLTRLFSKKEKKSKHCGAGTNGHADSNGVGHARVDVSAETNGVHENDESTDQHASLTGISSTQKTLWQRVMGITFMAISACLFSVMSFIVHIYGHGFPTFEVAAFRFLVQAVLAAIVLRYYRIPFSGWTGEYKLIFLRAMFGTVGMACAFWAFTHLPFSDATVIVFTNPVFTAVLAALILKERFSWLEGLSTFLCLLGIIFISRPTFMFGDTAYNPKTDAYSTKASELSNLEFAGLKFTASRPFAICMGLIGSVGAAFAYLTIRKLGKESTQVLVLWFGVVGFVAASLLGGIGQKWRWPSTAAEMFTLLGVGILGFVGQIFMSKGFQIENAGPAATMRNLDIVLAFIFQTTILNQPINAFSIVGAILVTVCALAVAYSKAKKPSNYIQLSSQMTPGDYRMNDEESFETQHHRQDGID